MPLCRGGIMTFTIITLHFETLTHLRYFVVDLVQRCVGADSLEFRPYSMAFCDLIFIVAKRAICWYINF